MAVLDSEALVALRQRLAEGERPSWVKSTANAAFQAAEDVLDGLAFDASGFIVSTDALNIRSQRVQNALDAGSIPSAIVPIVEDWLQDNPPTITQRAVDTDGLTAWIAGNTQAFSLATKDMPSSQHKRVVRFVTLRRIEAVL